MIFQNLSCVILLGILCHCTNPTTTEEQKTIVTDPFFGIQASDQPQLLAPNLLASPTEEYNGTFSPDGTEFYYTTDIPENAYITFTKLLPDNTWSVPQIASFSGEYSDYDPIFSPDGQRLYFSSSRPELDNMNSGIWYVERKNDAWGMPQSVNLTGAKNDEYYSSLTNEGNLYFNIWSTGDIFKATPSDTAYQIERLPDVINSEFGQGDPFISPEEDYIIFRGYGDKSLGRGDLFISFNINGEWTEPENLGKPINSSAHEICPYVTPDKKIFIFASSRIQDKLKTKPFDPIQKVQDKFQSYNNGEQNIYYTSADFIDRMKAKHIK